LAEVLVSPGSDALLTQARSDRQQRSRAFAAEFLAPSSGLRARLSRAVVGEHDVDAVAAEFGVSPLLVAHQLRNHDIARIR
jgi:Zn-dependent peptidase ImmA (M78 family)